MPTSLAILLRVPATKILEEIGHNGLEMLWVDNAPPFCFRGFHIQEIIDVCTSHGKCITPIESMPVSNNYILPVMESRLKSYMDSNTRGIVIGATHAVAWANGFYYDPKDGCQKAGIDFGIREFWMMHDVH